MVRKQVGLVSVGAVAKTERITVLIAGILYSSHDPQEGASPLLTLRLDSPLSRVLIVGRIFTTPGVVTLA